MSNGIRGLRIVLAQAKLRELVRERTLTIWTGSHRVEIMLADDVLAPPDPPQAKEFLPLRRRNHRK